MSLVHTDTKSAYYLSYYCILKSEKTSMKLCVVFDDSVATFTKLLLNDLQIIGPIIQSNSVNILIRFRRHLFIISTDIEKYDYDKSGAKIQCILWRINSHDPEQIYNLNTVTYGTIFASFLTIVQLAFKCERRLPNIAKVTLSNWMIYRWLN